MHPFDEYLGVKIEEVKPDFCQALLPFRPELRTAGSVVHGGAIASLIDTAAVVAVWSNMDPAITRGATIDLSVKFLAAAQAVDLSAAARIIRRGRSVSFCEVDVTSPTGELIAKGLVTYKTS